MSLEKHNSHDSRPYRHVEYSKVYCTETVLFNDQLVSNGLSENQIENRL